MCDAWRRSTSARHAPACCCAPPCQVCGGLLSNAPPRRNLVPVVATFEIEYLQYLDADGKLVREDLPEFAKDVKQLVELYKLMSFVRVFDTKSIALQPTSKLGTYASCLGMEAAHVAIGSAMAEDDVFAPMYREYAAQFHRGVKPREVLR